MFQIGTLNFGGILAPKTKQTNKTKTNKQTNKKPSKNTQTNKKGGGGGGGGGVERTL